MARSLAATVAGIALALAAAGCGEDAPAPQAPGNVAYFQRLTNTPIAESSPSFSPDGDEVAYERGDEIWVLDVTTRAARRVAPRGNHPSWSADGSAIVFSRRDLIGGGPLHRLVRLHLASGVVDTISADSIDAYEPAAAPVGNDVALRVLSRTNTRQTLRVLAPDGSDRVTLSPAGAWVDTQPAWSPDGRWIAFARVEDSGATRLLRIVSDGDLDATPVTGTTGTTDGISSPAWMGNDRLVYARGGVLSSISSAGGASTRLVQGDGFALSPTVSPDGTRLVFTTDRSGNFELWQLVDPAGIGTGPYAF